MGPLSIEIAHKVFEDMNKENKGMRIVPKSRVSTPKYREEYDKIFKKKEKKKELAHAKG